MREGWHTTTLNDACIQMNGIWKGTKEPLVPAKILRTTNFSKDCRIKLDDLAIIDVEKKKLDARRLLRGDIIVEKSGGGPKQPVGRVILFDMDDDDYSFCNFTSALRIKDPKIIDYKYLHKYLTYLYFEGETEKYQSNLVGFRNLDFKGYVGIEVPYPSLPEQQRIVDILDKEFAKIDALKANAEKSLQAAKNLFQATLKKELGGKTKDLATLLSICQSIVDCPHSTPIKSAEKTNFPCIRTSELKAGRISWATMQYVSEDEYRKRITRLQPQEGDIVYGREGTIGDAVMLPTGYHFCLGQRTMLFRPNRSLIDPKYLLYCVISPFVYNQAMSKNTGCGVAHVNVADVKQFLIPVPEQIDEQRRIVSCLDDFNDKCNALQENYQKTLTLCDDLKQSLLRKAFNGEL